MFWRVKSLHFKLLSLMPGGRVFYALTQERVTGSTAATLNRVIQKVAVGLRYWEWLRANGRTPQITDGSLLDYGAGWHPTIPLLWHSLGNNNQLLVDVAPNMDAEKISDTAAYLSEIISKPDWAGKEFCKRRPNFNIAPGASASEALQPFGIRYLAPCKNTLAESKARFDAIFCTQVLQHIDLRNQRQIFRDFHACLNPGGLVLATTHLVGHFRNPSLRAGQYQHLTPSPWIWENVFNSSLMSFNRLKPPDYRQLLEQSGFRILEFQVERPTAEDLAELARTRIHPSFNHYSPEDLAARLVFFVAEKK